MRTVHRFSLTAGRNLSIVEHAIGCSRHDWLRADQAENAPYYPMFIGEEPEPARVSSFTHRLLLGFGQFLSLSLGCCTRWNWLCSDRATGSVRRQPSHNCTHT
jgi:hypothetical protein